MFHSILFLLNGVFLDFGLTLIKLLSAVNKREISRGF